MTNSGSSRINLSKIISDFFRTIVETVRKNTHYAGLKTMEKIMFDYNDVAITLGQDLSVEVNIKETVFLLFIPVS